MTARQMKLERRFGEAGAAGVFLALLLLGCAVPRQHDLVIRGGQIYDGLGGAPFVGDLAVDGDRIS
jgi:N-acyl-D-amino-acid deacylase